MALKVVKSAAHYTETALDEIKLLKCVSFLKYFLKEITEFIIYKIEKQKLPTYMQFLFYDKKRKSNYGQTCYILCSNDKQS